jgi:hypothetical protein
MRVIVPGPVRRMRVVMVMIVGMIMSMTVIVVMMIMRMGRVGVLTHRGPQ